MSDLPERIVVDQHGHYWRDFGDYWSMCPVSEENVDTEVVATYIRAGAAPRAEGLERRAAAATPSLDVDWRNVCIARVDWDGEDEAWEAWIGVSPTDAGLRRGDRIVGLGGNPREAVRDLAARLDEGSATPEQKR